MNNLTSSFKISSTGEHYLPIIVEDFTYDRKLDLYTIIVTESIYELFSGDVLMSTKSNTTKFRIDAIKVIPDLFENYNKILIQIIRHAVTPNALTIEEQLSKGTELKLIRTNYEETTNNRNNR